MGCNCQQTRADIVTAVRSGQIIKAAQITVQGAKQIAKSVIKPSVVRSGRR